MKAAVRILSAVVVLVLLFALGGEFGVRWYVNREAEQRIGSSLENPHLSFPVPSLLLDATDRDLSHLRFSADGDISLEADIKHLDVSDSQNPIAQDMDVTVELSDTYLLSALQQQQESMGLGRFLDSLTQVTQYTSSASTGTSTVVLGNNTAQVEIVPFASGGEFQVDTTSLNLKGLSLSDSLGDLVTSAISRAVNDTLGDFTFTDVTVSDGLTRVHVNAQNINLENLRDLPQVGN